MWGINVYDLARAMDEEEASAILLDDTRYHALVGPKASYRKTYGILDLNQLEEVYRREYLVETAENVEPNSHAGMYWRTHPRGRRPSTEAERARGQGFYA